MLLPARLPGAPRGGVARARELIAELGLAPSPTIPRTSSPAASSNGSPSPGRSSTIPVLVLADEPTGNLDTTAAGDVLRLLREMTGRGRAVVMVTHEPEIAAAADRVLEMADGRLG